MDNSTLRLGRRRSNHNMPARNKKKSSKGHKPSRAPTSSSPPKFLPPGPTHSRGPNNRHASRRPSRDPAAADSDRTPPAAPPARPPVHTSEDDEHYDGESYDGEYHD